MILVSVCDGILRSHEQAFCIRFLVQVRARKISGVCALSAGLEAEVEDAPLRQAVVAMARDLDYLQ